MLLVLFYCKIYIIVSVPIQRLRIAGLVLYTVLPKGTALLYECMASQAMQARGVLVSRTSRSFVPLLMLPLIPTKKPTVHFCLQILCCYCMYLFDAIYVHSRLLVVFIIWQFSNVMFVVAEESGELIKSPSPPPSHGKHLSLSLTASLFDPVIF